MTYQTFWDTQLLGETKKWSADLDQFIPSGGSVTAVTGSYAYRTGSPSGSVAATVTGGSIVSLTFSAPCTGVAYLDAYDATMTDSQDRRVRWVIRVDF